MRTTIRLDDALLRRAKATAAASGRSLNDFVADAVRAALASRPEPARVTELPTFKGHGLRGGVDLDDTGALLDLMELYDREDTSNRHTSVTRARRVAERRPRRAK